MGEAALNQPHFQDADKAREYLEALRWSNGITCPHCGVVDHAYDLKGDKHRAGLYKCGGCRKQFTVTVGTVFERSKIKLHIWLQAVHLMCASKKGISSKQLERMLGVTYKTAWFMSHRIREAMSDEDRMTETAYPLLGKLLELTEGISKEFTRMWLSRNGEVVAAFTDETRRALIDLMGQPYVSFGAAKGKIERYNSHAPQKYFYLYPAIGARVKCVFDDELREQAARAVDQSVNVTGFMKYRRGAFFPFEIAVSSIEMLPDDDVLPTLASLSGVAPNATGELTAEEFIRRARHGWN